MAEVVYLNTARKTREKAAAKVHANANAAKHGHSKALKSLEKARRDKEKAKLDNHRRDGQD